MAFTFRGSVMLIDSDMPNDGKNFRVWASAADREAEFESAPNLPFSNVSTIKMGEPLRIDSEQQLVMDKYNYLRFRNDTDGKYYYAFITDIKWLSISACLVYWDIDWWTTYQFDITIRKGLIEREHTKNDTVTDLPEPMPPADYVYSNVANYGMDGNTNHRIYLVFCAEIDGAWGITDMSKCDGMEIGAHIFAVGPDYPGTYGVEGGAEYPLTPVQLCTALNALKDGNVIGTIWIDSTWVTLAGATVSIPVHNIPIISAYHVTNISFRGATLTYTHPDNFGTYTPRCKKTQRYPFRCAILSNNQGAVKELKYERFSTSGTATVDIKGAAGLSIASYAQPSGYRGSGGQIDRVNMTCSAPAPSRSNAMEQWLGRNAAGIATGLVGAAVGLASGTPMGIAAAATTVTSTLGQMYTANYQADTVNVAENSLTPLFRNGVIKWSMYDCRVTADYAQYIDNIFHMYGYASNRLGRPAFDNRTNWYFCKMRDCSVKGTIPKQGANYISNALVSGCTFWHDDEIGNYDRDNNS